MSELPVRIPIWKAKRVLALHLYERGPVTAAYQGEMADKIAHILDRHPDTRRTSNYSPAQALAILREMEAESLVKIEGTQQKPTKVEWINLDPNGMVWHETPQRPPSKTEKLEAEVADLRATVLEMGRAITALSLRLDGVSRNVDVTVEQAIRRTIEKLEREQAQRSRFASGK